MPARKTTEHSESKPKRKVVRRKHAPTTDGVSKPEHADESFSFSTADKKAISDKVDAITRKPHGAEIISPIVHEEPMPVHEDSGKEIEESEGVQEQDVKEESQSVSEPPHAHEIHQAAYGAAGTIPVVTSIPRSPVSPSNTDSVMPVPETSRITPTPKDAGFLAPAHDTFNLRRRDDDDEDYSEGSGWVKKVIYTLIVLIALAAVALVALTFYAPEILNKIKGGVTNNTTQPVTQDPEQNTGNPGGQTDQEPATPAVRVVNVVNASNEIQSFVRSSVGTQYGNTLRITFDNAVATPTQTNVTSDTLYFKDGLETDAVTIQNVLATAGIKVKVEENADLKSDFVLALAKTITPDLSNLTAAVYNATGVSGLARKYCTTLEGYRVVSCNALNATTSATGLVVSLKNSALAAQLQRTSDYANAKFTTAPSSQVQDIVVTIGK